MPIQTRSVAAIRSQVTDKQQLIKNRNRGDTCDERLGKLAIDCGVCCFSERTLKCEAFTVVVIAAAGICTAAYYAYTGAVCEVALRTLGV